jgi:flagellar basal body-associated protein FliL
MFSWILQISIISIIFIFLVHHLLCFFKTTLTVPKMKDLVNSPVKKYQDIFDTISNSNTNKNFNTNFNKYLPSDGEYTDINLLPTENMNVSSSVPDMKDELKSFLKKQLKNSDTNELESANSSSNFGSIF